jgi:hypothetical protein
MDHVGIAMTILNGRPLTDELLQEILGMLTRLDANLDPEGLKHVRDKLESTIGIKMAVGEVMRESSHQPWLLDAKGAIDWHYWDSYKRLLASQGWSPNVVRVLDEDTDNILTECGHAVWEGAWNIRGLVMGDVQSGKTASYSGVIAKAADAGYRVVVLLTGVIEDLRKQTQERLDAGFVGRDSRDVFGKSRNMQPVGAGIYRNKSANVLTSVDFDFLTNNAQILGGIPLANISEPILFVMKKNKSPLENLLKWLDAQLKLTGLAKHQLPLLVIDDEADNASVNVRKVGEEPATINRLIRGVVGKFSRSSYIAYTATPFANVFINPDDESDLFPSNFIYSLNTPSHYIGAGSIFLEDGKHFHQLQDVDDAEDYFPYSHKKEHPLTGMPDSLKDAIRVFLLSCAIRDIRNEELRHRSMLVNVSRFTDVQARVSEQVSNFLWSLQEEVKQYLASMSWQHHPELLKLQSTWSEEFVDSGVCWEQIRERLNDAIASIKVVTINQKSAREEKLDYSRYKNTEKGRRVIAVGGLTLSRGLTLEGLCVSYFYRNSKAYDTLLQMGRWFGYRQGYEDLFRIWMDRDAQAWYAHIAGAVAELRTDFRRMSANRLPPSQFGIRVKSHPDTLIVTAQNKMRNAKEVVHSVSFSAFGTETPFIPKSPTLNSQNVNRVAILAQDEGPTSTGNNRYLWKAVPRERVAAFLSELNISNMNMQFLSDPDTGLRPLFQFIEENEYSALGKWDICIPQGQGAAVPGVEIALPNGKAGKVQCRRRQFERTSGSALYWKLNKQRVGDASDEKVGMLEGQVELAELEWARERAQDDKKGESVPGYMYRRFRSTPLLTIHFIECADPGPNAKPQKMLRAEEVGKEPMVAISLSFPDFDPMAKGKPVIYRLNKIALRDLLGEDNNDDED